MRGGRAHQEGGLAGRGRCQRCCGGCWRRLGRLGAAGGARREQRAVQRGRQRAHGGRLGAARPRQVAVRPKKPARKYRGAAAREGLHAAAAAPNAALPRCTAWHAPVEPAGRLRARRRAPAAPVWLRRRRGCPARCSRRRCPRPRRCPPPRAAAACGRPAPRGAGPPPAPERRSAARRPAESGTEARQLSFAAHRSSVTHPATPHVRPHGAQLVAAQRLDQVVSRAAVQAIGNLDLVIAR